MLINTSCIYFNPEIRILQIKMHIYDKKLASGRVRISKPWARPLHAEVPCNYTLGRLAAALQSVFEIRPLPRASFL